MKRTVLFLLLVAAIAMIFPACPSETPPPGGETPPPSEGGIMQWDSPPPMTIDPSKEYQATIKTNFGDFVVQLFPEDAPLAVNNFVFLSRQGFYDGVKFYKVVKDFIIHTGDPTNTGKGGPGYTFADEPVTRDYVAGTLAMEINGPNTNGSRFFITLVDLSSALPKIYTIFGQVISGFDVVQKIGDVPVKASETGGLSVPKVDVHIDTIIIEKK